MSKRKVITPRGATALCPRCREQAPIHTHRNVKRPVFTDHFDGSLLRIRMGLYCPGSGDLVDGTSVTNTGGEPTNLDHGMRGCGDSPCWCGRCKPQSAPDTNTGGRS